MANSSGTRSGRARRHTWQWISLVLIGWVLGATLGCSKDPAREGQKWQKLKEQGAEYATTWPKFKSVIDARLAEGDKAIEATKSISDKEKQGEAMSEAIDTYGAVINRLGEVKYKTKAIDDAITKLNRLKIPKNQSSKRKSVISSAREKMLAVSSQLDAATPTTEAEALAALKPAVSSLITIKGNVDRAIKALTPKKN